MILYLHRDFKKEKARKDTFLFSTLTFTVSFCSTSGLEWYSEFYSATIQSKLLWETIFKSPFRHNRNRTPQENPKHLSIAAKGFVTAFTSLQELTIVLWSFDHFHRKKPFKTIVGCCQLEYGHGYQAVGFLAVLFDSLARSQTPWYQTH